MKLYNVDITAIFDASYEGVVDKSYTQLVFANSKEDAIKLVNDNLNKFKEFTTKQEAKTAYEVDTSQGNRKRKASFYVA